MKIKRYIKQHKHWLEIGAILLALFLMVYISWQPIQLRNGLFKWLVITSTIAFLPVFLSNRKNLKPPTKFLPKCWYLLQGIAKTWFYIFACLFFTLNIMLWTSLMFVEEHSMQAKITDFGSRRRGCDPWILTLQTGVRVSVCPQNNSGAINDIITVKVRENFLGYEVRKVTDE
ncbi:hypothetical protein LVJ85_05990 [Neisseria sp. Dent CA1/247]|uniref:hypothetical protein n=1 Tax=Neisseria sp. Dent CA1/247 TaxID=2912675 RepID=UPI001FD5A83B|nr:hypothetical protein [Neisseria sp. Dent CA1/247]UOO78008.1 hypothetical protein LVJ85_05990 [Neisseria sp. Dent CA1/247]